jgi:hypothetical protein
MVAAQHDPRRIEADPGCDRLDQTAEVGRRHAGGALRAPLVDDGADPCRKDLGDSGVLIFGGREQGEFAATGQKEVASAEELFASLAKTRQIEHPRPEIRVERDGAAARLHGLSRLEDDVHDLRREEGRSRHMEMVAAVENRARRLVEFDASRGALLGSSTLARSRRPTRAIADSRRSILR